MTISEIEQHLDPNRFEPFRLNLNNGQSFEVRHPELAAIMDTGVLYIFKPSLAESPARRYAGVLAICALHNICTLEPLDQAA